MAQNRTYQHITFDFSDKPIVVLESKILWPYEESGVIAPWRAGTTTDTYNYITQYTNKIVVWNNRKNATY